MSDEIMRFYISWHGDNGRRAGAWSNSSYDVKRWAELMANSSMVHSFCVYDNEEDRIIMTNGKRRVNGEPYVSPRRQCPASRWFNSWLKRFGWT